MVDRDPRQVIVGTAGHVDHGKTALIKALTGVDADTLEEEKRRGITIELGFVFMAVPEDTPQVVFVDVPGHEKLIRTMVAGASSLQAALLVVAADEGIQPQTREHCEILGLLGVERGVVALTKCDLVEVRDREARVAEVETFLADTALAGAPVLGVSAVTGEGVEELRSALNKLAQNVPPRPASELFRLPVDRVFTMHGFGTVVAGTVWGGQVRPGDRIMVYPDRMETRVRGVQVHGQTVETARLGMRAALNLPDLRKEDLRRGQCVAAVGALETTTRLDVQVSLLPGAAEQKNRVRVRLHLSTEEVICSLVLLDRDRLRGGDTAPAQLLLEAPLVAVRGDRFVLRSLNPLLTIGGGTVLDPNPGSHRRRAASTLEAFDRLAGGPAEVVEQALLKAGTQPQDVPALARATGLSEDEITPLLGGLVATERLVPINSARKRETEATSEPASYLHANAYRSLEKCLLGTMTEYFQRHPYRVHMPASELQARLLQRTTRPAALTLIRDLRDQGVLGVTERGFSLVDRPLQLSPGERELLTQLETAFLEGGLAPKAEETLREEMGLTATVFTNLMTALTDQGLVVRLPEKVTIHGAYLTQAREEVARLLAKEGAVTVGGLRDQLGCSRKHAVALLEHFDSAGMTRRVDDRRLPGPALTGEV